MLFFAPPPPQPVRRAARAASRAIVEKRQRTRGRLPVRLRVNTPSAGACEPLWARQARLAHVRVRDRRELLGAERPRDLLRRRIAVDRRALPRHATRGTDQRLHLL